MDDYYSYLGVSLTGVCRPDVPLKTGMYDAGSDVDVVRCLSALIKRSTSGCLPDTSLLKCYK